MRAPLSFIQLFDKFICLRPLFYFNSFYAFIKWASPIPQHSIYNTSNILFYLKDSIIAAKPPTSILIFEIFNYLRDLFKDRPSDNAFNWWLETKGSGVGRVFFICSLLITQLWVSNCLTQ